MSSKLPRQASLSSSSTEPGQRIKVLVDYGSQVEVDKSLAVKLYFRSGREMLRMANMYCDDGQLESAFILYYKFITLFVEKLQSHPDYKHAPHDDISDFKRKVKKVFPIAEEIKSKLKKRYIEEERIYIEEQKRLAEERAAEEERRRKALEEQERQDEELAKRLQEEEEAEVKNEQDEKYWKLRQQEEEKMKEEERRKDKDQNGDSSIRGATEAALAAAGAGMGAGVAASTFPGAVATATVPQAVDSSGLPPPPSYSQYLSDIGNNPPQIPDRQLKKNLVISDLNTPLDQSQIPSVDRSKKPAIDHHMSLGEFGGLQGGQLRTVIVPAQLMSRFLSAAEGNTAREAETMGILCGKLSQGTFRITHLFIPQQKGGHDSCDMENEEELIFYQDNHNLITLGWIHTHPTQTAFLSSVDLHSHFPWQKMMPEAIAIVCSPKFQETGIFKLTDHGLDVIGSCREKGFHPHSKDPPLFETCDHVQVSESDSVIVDDRRK